MSPLALAVILAACAQALLTLWAIMRMEIARVACLNAGGTTLSDVALSDRPWPEPIQKLQANVRNQFETPVLLFAGIAIALGGNVAGWGVAIFAWLYVVSRIVHRAIHVGSNDVRWRFCAYVAGLGALLGLWVAVFAGVLLP